MTEMTFDEWAEHGWRQGWCGPPLCLAHNGFPFSEEEDDWYVDGGDPCSHFIRLYEDKIQRLDVERNHEATNWRASNMGWKRDV